VAPARSAERYEGGDFPPQYKGTYFQGDYEGQWIRNFVFDTNNKPVAVRPFLTNGGGIVCIATSRVGFTTSPGRMASNESVMSAAAISHRRRWRSRTKLMGLGRSQLSLMAELRQILK
jgi:hypothetical protein